ncbi:peptide ABC transporter ATPase [Liquorilactobacillus aquaticus DSM 21051]|uniref:Peptide ABC transporter ATPase n=1 Tax=Liquorilactobacillus aquaticus DSM 21051 TaxID=1423725 RepID=A0A0R2CVY9_9LACO|nr:ABC transporter ATP-binding protein [Liquorilactobacillus aquaticus]KRM95378.1 peptide ABC transporter ATPase [Liquorilactobacillus aquaticus DSM 21051]
MLTTKNLEYWYDHKENKLFNNANLEFAEGKLYAIIGSSGSGKTTFLSLLAGLDKPSAGAIEYQGVPLSKIGLTNYRNKNVSMVFQSYNLFNYMSALENVLTAMAITKAKHANDKEYVFKMLSNIGIDQEMAKKKVTHLSGGQQQRVAIARTMCCDARLVVADEPTGNLDEQNTREVLNLFKDLAHKQKKCVILVTHEPEVASLCDQIIELKNKKFSIV